MAIYIVRFISYRASSFLFANIWKSSSRWKWPHSHRAPGVVTTLVHSHRTTIVEWKYPFSHSRHEVRVKFGPVAIWRKVHPGRSLVEEALCVGWTGPIKRGRHWRHWSRHTWR